jgi:hypothetical protein
METEKEEISAIAAKLGLFAVAENKKETEIFCYKPIFQRSCLRSCR